MATQQPIEPSDYFIQMAWVHATEQQVKNPKSSASVFEEITGNRRLARSGSSRTAGAPKTVVDAFKAHEKEYMALYRATFHVACIEFF